MELALVLTDGPDEAVAFPGVPGTWIPGRPIPLRELEVDEEQARALAAGPLGLDLTEVAAGTVTPRENRLASENLRRRGVAVVEAQPDEPTPGADVEASAAPPEADAPGEAQPRGRRRAPVGDQEQPAEPSAGDGPETGEA